MNTETSPERFAQLHPRIQQKILSARAAAEGREQKKEDRQALKDWIRHEELRAIPIKERMPEEQKEFQRMRRKVKNSEEEGGRRFATPSTIQRRRILPTPRVKMRRTIRNTRDRK